MAFSISNWGKTHERVLLWVYADPVKVSNYEDTLIFFIHNFRLYLKRNLCESV
jgi:hypothetical protein